MYTFYFFDTKKSELCSIIYFSNASAKLQILHDELLLSVNITKRKRISTIISYLNTRQEQSQAIPMNYTNLASFLCLYDFANRFTYAHFY